MPLSPDRNEIAGDLRTLASIRSRATVRTRPLPHLEALLPSGVGSDPEARYAALEDLIETAVAAMNDHDHQLAAQRLVGRGPGRWRPLKQRGAEAASVFQIGWDGYRRRHDDHGRSALDETLDLVAEAIIAGSGAGPAIAGGAPPVARSAVVLGGPSVPTDGVAVRIDDAGLDVHASSARTVPISGSTTKRFWALVAVVALLAGTVSAVVILGVQRPGTREAAGADCEELDSTVGDLGPGSDPVLAAWSEPFRTYAAGLDSTLVRCADPIQTSQGEVFQRVAADGTAPVGALVVTADASPTAIVYLSPPELATFTTRELETAETQDRLGKVIGRDDRPDGTKLVTFGSGVIVSESGDAPAIAVTKRFWDAWTELGGLDGAPGRPIGVAHTATGESRRQDFEGGRLEAGFDDGELTWVPITTEPPPLPSDHLGRIVTASDTETSWYLDPEGARHWIPSAQDMACVEGTQVQPTVTDVDVRVIDALPLASVLRCT